MDNANKANEILDFLRGDKTFLFLVGQSDTGMSDALHEAVDRYRELVKQIEIEASTIFVSNHPHDHLHPLYVESRGSPNAKIIFLRHEIEAPDSGAETIVFENEYRVPMVHV